MVEGKWLAHSHISNVTKTLPYIVAQDCLALHPVFCSAVLLVPLAEEDGWEE